MNTMIALASAVAVSFCSVADDVTDVPNAPMRGFTKLTWVVHAYANFGPDDQHIVFQSNAPGNWDLYIVDLRHGALRTLISHPAADITPVFSPDGARVAFVSERDGNREVYLASADGQSLTRLTRETGHDIHPVFSADGAEIMFSSNRGNDDPEDYDIYVMAADGSNVRQITDGPEVDTYASWSPDGTRIVTRRVINGNNEVFVLNADGSEARNLTNNIVTYDGWPVWSPDGRRIAFASGLPAGGSHSVYLIDADGGGLTRITQPAPGMPANFTYNTQPCFSRDGRRLAFTMYRPGPRESSEICIIDVPPATPSTDATG